MYSAVRVRPSKAAAGNAHPTHSLPADEPLLMAKKAASGNAVRFGQFDRRLQGKHLFVGASLGCRPVCAAPSYRLANAAPSNGYSASDVMPAVVMPSDTSSLQGRGI
jgi:hypothetical protein